MNSVGSAQEDSLTLLALARNAGRDGEGRRLREAACLSLAEVARAVGAAPNSVRRWESGDVRPTGERARQYGEMLRRLLAIVEVSR